MDVKPQESYPKVRSPIARAGTVKRVMTHDTLFHSDKLNKARNEEVIPGIHEYLCETPKVVIPTHLFTARQLAAIRSYASACNFSFAYVGGVFIRTSISMYATSTPRFVLYIISDELLPELAEIFSTR